MDGQQRDFPKRLEAIVKRYLGRFRNRDTVHDALSIVWCSSPTTRLAAAEDDESERKQVEDAMLALAKRTAGTLAKQMQRSQQRHLSGATPIGDSEHAEAHATVEVLLRAQDQFVMENVLAGEVIEDARRLLWQMLAEGEVKNRAALEQMEEVTELILREGIKLPQALREVQAMRGNKIGRSTAYALWKKILRSLRLSHGYLRPKGTSERRVQRKKQPMQTIEAERDGKNSPVPRKKPTKTRTDTKKLDTPDVDAS